MQENMATFAGLTRPSQAMNCIEGIAIRSTGSWYSIEHDGKQYECRTRGRIRLKGARTTNPIAIGDRVLFFLENENQGVITEILPRRNYIIRRATNLSKETHIIAANLDLAAVVVTLTAPPTLLAFIDRFLATACAYRIPSVVLLAKQDLATERNTADELNFEAVYATAGCSVLRISANSGQGITDLSTLLTGKTTLLAGHSGVGKSTLINTLQPSLNLKTAPLSSAYGLGQHTTTCSEMYSLSFAPNTRIIDTPGIKGFGVVDFAREEIAHFFPDIFSISQHCRFGNCLHEHEPGCAVIDALDNGTLAPSRYDSYISLLHDDHEKYR